MPKKHLEVRSRLKRPYFPTIKAYGQAFTDVYFWRPYIDQVWFSEGLGAIHTCTAGMPGTNPVFMINDNLVIKFFTDLFGFDADKIELAFYKDIEPHLKVPTPSLITHGQLFKPEADQGWHYPYIVTTRLKGISFGEIEMPTRESRIEAAHFAAHVLRSFHNIPLPDEGVLAGNWEGFEKVLSHRRGKIRLSIEQLPVAPALRADLLERLDKIPLSYETDTTPKLLHGDLNQDHILGVVRDHSKFNFTGVIDFGDVKVGDPLYDLVPLHLGLFDGDHSLLRAFLETYEIPVRKGESFAESAMNYTLLYESDVLTAWFNIHEDWRDIPSLSEFQDRLWGI